MPEYTYSATHLVTGQLLADTIPLHVSSFSSVLPAAGAPGKLSGYLDLNADSPIQRAYLGVLEPRRTLLWVRQRQEPIWAGVLWDWPVASAASGQLPIAAAEIGSLFARRQIRTDLAYTATDVFAVVRAVLSYAVGKSGGTVAALSLGSGTSGHPADVTFPAANLAMVVPVLDAFAAAQGFEYAFLPGLDSSGTPVIILQLGYPTITRPAASTGLQLAYPGNVSDYGYPRIGSDSTNSLLVTATSSGQQAWSSGATHGLNTTELAAGYPLLESSQSYTASAIAAQGQIDAVADGIAPRLAGTTTVPSVTITAGVSPQVADIRLGDQAALAATSPLHPANTDGSPGLQTTVRIIGWTVTPSDGNQAGSTAYLLGGITT